MLSVIKITASTVTYIFSQSNTDIFIQLSPLKLPEDNVSASNL